MVVATMVGALVIDMAGVLVMVAVMVATVDVVGMDVGTGNSFQTTQIQKKFINTYLYIFISHLFHLINIFHNYF